MIINILYTMIQCEDSYHFAGIHLSIYYTQWFSVRTLTTLLVYIYQYTIHNDSVWGLLPLCWYTSINILYTMIQCEDSYHFAGIHLSIYYTQWFSVRTLTTLLVYIYQYTIHNDSVWGLLPLCWYTSINILYTMIQCEDSYHFAGIHRSDWWISWTHTPISWYPEILYII